MDKLRNCCETINRMFWNLIEIYQIVYNLYKDNFELFVIELEDINVKL